MHYHFTTKEQFCQEIAEGKFLEYAEVHGRCVAGAWGPEIADAKFLEYADVHGRCIWNTCGRVHGTDQTHQLRSETQGRNTHEGMQGWCVLWDA